MDQLQVVEENGHRVLTTAQLAEAYGTESERITKNFNRNKDRYTEGKHFIQLEGGQLKEFRATGQIDLPQNTNKLYLWTEKGAWLHAKSLNTDEAWEAYEKLVDDYYRIAQTSKSFDTSQLSPELQMFQKIFNSVAQQQLEQKRLAAKVEQTERKVDSISEIVALSSTDWRKDTTAILNKIAIETGGFDQYRNIRNESYELLEQRANAKLSIRVANKQKKMALEGATKSKINKVTKLDAIEDDKRLLEIYLAVVKEMAIKYQVDYSSAV